jgi:hypothetical protein
MKLNKSIETRKEATEVGILISDYTSALEMAYVCAIRLRELGIDTPTVRKPEKNGKNSTMWNGAMWLGH